MDDNLKFGRLALASSTNLDAEVKDEQTHIMVQSMLQSQPLLFRRYCETKVNRFFKKKRFVPTRPKLKPPMRKQEQTL